MPCVAVISTGRADLGLLTPILDACAHHQGLTCELFVTGALVSPDGTPTIDRPVAAAIPVLDDASNAPDMAAAIARGVAGFAEAFSTSPPDAVLLLGDRFETLAAAVAAAAKTIPIVHLHGGEHSAGAADNQFRYAISALASIHLTATDRARRVLIAMGEPETRVHRVGAPGLDTVRAADPMPRNELAGALGLKNPDDPYLLVTLHPTTLDPTPPAEHARTLLTALDAAGMPCVITHANQDPGGDAINAVLIPAARERGWPAHAALGHRLYIEAMRRAAAMVGNSSSGIIEAHSLALPVVNIGDRQQGRERNPSVIDTPFETRAITDAIRRATEPQLRGRINSEDNIYGDGRTAPRVADILASTTFDASLLRKPFLPPGVG